MASDSGDGRELMAAAAEARAREAFAVQQELIGLPETSHTAEVQRRAAGRPPGARNKRSEDVAAYVIEKLGDPLLMLAALATMNAEELAAAAGCSKFEAIQEKRLAAAIVLPFLHRRMPLAVDVNNRTFVHLAIGELGAAQVAGAPLDEVEIVAIQGVIDAPPDAV